MASFERFYAPTEGNFMKTILGLILIIAPFTASAALEEKVECEITKINGSLSSFLPPVIGSRITIDTRENSLAELTFSDGRMIPLDAPLTKVEPGRWSDHLVTYESKVTDSYSVEDTVLIQIGRFSDGVIAATLQRLGRNGRDQLWFMEEAHARCKAL